MTDEQENGACGRLLKALEQRIRRAAFHVVDAVDSDHTPVADRRTCRKQRAEKAYLIDGNVPREVAGFLVGQSVEASEIRMASRFDQTRTLRCQIAGIEQQPSSVVGETPLTHPARSGEKPRMMHTLPRHRGAECGNLQVKAVEFQKKSLTAISRRSDTASIAPVASTILIRSGSICASCSNLAATTSKYVPSLAANLSTFGPSRS